MAKVSSIAGDPGLGKSTMTLDLAARVSRGLELPGDATAIPAAPVVLFCLEDDLACTVRPRLEAAGADLTKIIAVAGKDACRFRLPGSIQRLHRLVDESGARLVVMDPLTAFLGGDSHKDAEVRQALHPLVDMATDTKAAVVVVRHLNKALGGTAIHRGGGSIAIVGVVRSELLVAEDPDDPQGRVLASVKSNLGPSPVSLRFRLASAGDSSRIEWGDECELSANELVAAPRPRQPKRQKAKNLISRMLKDGPVASKELIAAAEAEGIPLRTFRRATKELGLPKPMKDGLNGWIHLPAE